jgi:predicted DNA-binding transcriptional regulator AlpA
MNRKVAVPAAVRLGIAELEARTGWHRTTIWRKYRAGLMPKPHFLGERRFWWLSDIEEWEREQMSRPRDARRGDANLHRTKP